MAKKRRKTRSRPAKARAKVQKRPQVKARPKPRPKAKPKTKPKKPARRVYDWTKRKAPPETSSLRESYEKSATYRKRVKASKKGVETRRKHEAAEKRRIEREEKIARAKELLSPLLTKVISDYNRAGAHGQGMKDSRDSHGNWYQAKMNLADFLPERDYMRVLEELSQEHDLDGLGWDILY